MVTTRNGTETPGVPTPTPRSSTRKTAGKRELDSIETPTQAKRQRKAAPKSTPKKKGSQEVAESDASAEDPSQGSAEDVSDAIAVAALPTESTDTHTKEDLLPIRRRSSPQVIVPKDSPAASGALEAVENKNEDDTASTQETQFHTPSPQSGSVYATPATHIQPREASPTPKATGAADVPPPSTSTKKTRGRPRKTPKKEETSTQQILQTPSKFLDEIPSSTYESETAPILSQESIPTSAQPHRRFGSEEPAEVQTSPVVNRKGRNRYAAPQTTQEEPVDGDDDDASDSDEAPEIVTTAVASSKAQAAQAEADRAQLAQQAKEQAKRLAREELIAAQQAAKREREEKKAQKLAKKAAREQKAAIGSDDEEVEPASRMDIDVSNGLLPASLLETIDDQRPPTPPPERRGKTEEELRKEKLNQHIKFLERTDKPAKDVKKGKLNVAVLAQQNRVLPPRVNRNTKNVREQWLKGRKVDKRAKGVPLKFGKMERRAHGNRGFLRNGDD